MAGRKVFTSGEILTAADVNSFLMNQVVAVFADSTARSSAIPSPSEGMVTYLEDVGGAQGLEVFDGSVFTPIGNAGIGSNVVSVTKNDTFTHGANTDLVDVTGLAATMTPSSATSKILIIADLTIATSQAGFRAAFLVTDSSNNPVVAASGGSQYDGVSDFADVNGLLRQTKHYVASPATVSPVTFKVRVANISGGGRLVFVNRSPNGIQTAVSTITLIEVAG